MTACLRATILASAALALSACWFDECEQVACPAVACIDPFTLTVTDSSTGLPIDGASASGDVPCVTTLGGVACDAGGEGVFTVTVTAPGYAPSEVTVTVSPGVAGTDCTCPVCAPWHPTSVALSAS